MKYVLLSITLLYTWTTVFATCPTKCRCTHFLLGLYDSVQCSNMSFTELPFGNLDFIVGKLDLSFNELTVLKNDTFLDREINFLDKLMLNNNKIHTIEVNAFRGMAHLTYMNLRQNNITVIHSNLFEGVPELRILNLNGNPNLHLPSTGFVLTKLSILDLSYCNLRNIPDNFFAEMKTLDILTLSGNKLPRLNPSLIAPLSRLEYLDLRGNRFYQLEEELLLLPHSLDIDLQGNPFRCDCELQQMYAIYKTRVHNEMLVCFISGATDVIEPTQSNLKSLKCFETQHLNIGVITTPSSLFTMVCLLLLLLLNNLLRNSR